VHALRGWPTPMGVAVNTAPVFDENGRIISGSLRQAIETMADQLVAAQFVSAQAENNPLPEVANG